MKRTGSLYLMVMGLAIVTMFSVTPVLAQTAPAAQTQDDYLKVITNRAAKIVAAFHSSDTVFTKKVTAVIADQYISLGRIHDGRNAKIKEIKSKGTELTADDKAAIQ